MNNGDWKKRPDFRKRCVCGWFLVNMFFVQKSYTAFYIMKIHNVNIKNGDVLHFFFAFGLYHEMISCTFLSDVWHFSLIQSLFQISSATTVLLSIRYNPSNNISKDLIFLNFVGTSNPQNIILYKFICKGKKVIFPLVGIRDYIKIRPYEPVKFQQSAKISSHKFNDSTGVHHSFTYI